MTSILNVKAETRVNSFTAGDQQGSAIASLSGGGYVITWQSDGQDGSLDGIYAQRYDASGTALGSETLINTHTTGAQADAAVTGLSDGGYLIAWTSDGQDGSSGGIYAQRFSAAGAAVGSEFKANTYTLDSQDTPSVTGLTGGGFVITWNSMGQDGDVSGVYAQRYNASGAAVGTETLVNTTTDFDELGVRVTGLNDGGYVVTWFNDTANGGGGYGGYGGYGGDGYMGPGDGNIFAQRYTANGTPVGGETMINTTATGYQYYPDITALNDGGYVVTWVSAGQDGSGDGIYAQRYSSAGTTVGPETHISTYTLGNQADPWLTQLTDGGYIIGWVSSGQAGGDDIYAQRFDAAGNAIGPEFLVNTVTAGTQESPDFAALAGGGLVATWTSTVEDGSGAGIYQKVFESTSNLAGAQTLYGTAGADILAGGAGADTMYGGAGFDMIDYASASAGITVFLGSNYLNTGDATGDVYVNVEGVSGSAFADILGGDGSDNRLEGNNGNDWLYGSGGQDYILGGDGNDVLNGGAGNDVLDGGNGQDVAYYRDAASGITIDALDNSQNLGDAAGDVLVNVENIWGSDFADTIKGSNLGGQVYGFAGNDVLIGRTGNDVFYGGSGADNITTGSGNDDIFFLSYNNHLNQYGTLEANEGGDTITDFAHGVDHITVSRYWFGFGNIAGPAAALTAANADFITTGTTPVSARPTFFWNAATGVLLFDPDGTGAGAAVNIATFTNATALTLSDIWTA